MAKSSINFAKASNGGLHHNDRSEKKEPAYLLPVEHRLKNDFDVSAHEAENKIKDLYSQAKENYKKTFKQPLKAKSYLWEAVVNLNKKHTLEDVQRLTKEIEKETGFTSVQIAIHRDEGHINERGGVQRNIHAHITFFTLNKKTGQQLYRRALTERQKRENPDLKAMDRNRLSKLQDITAEILNMQRGKKGSRAVRLSHNQYKAVKQAEKVKLAKVQDLKDEVKKLREELKENKATRAEYAKLEEENRQLKVFVKRRELTVIELERKIEELRQELKEKISKEEQINQSTPNNPDINSKEIEAITTNGGNQIHMRANNILTSDNSAKLLEKFVMEEAEHIKRNGKIVAIKITASQYNTLRKKLLEREKKIEKLLQYTKSVFTAFSKAIHKGKDIFEMFKLSSRGIKKDQDKPHNRGSSR